MWELIEKAIQYPFGGVDLYCERGSTLFWAEPINALTNFSFVIAAVLAYLYLKRNDGLDAYHYILIITTIFVGLGSFLFHTYANNLTRLIDVIPIFLFKTLFIYFYLTKIIKLQWFYPIIIIIILIASSSFISDQAGKIIEYFDIPTEGYEKSELIISTSLSYLPALIILLAIAVLEKIKLNRNYIFFAALVFLFSIFFRTMDPYFCHSLNFGLHFLWHILNGVLLYLLIRAMQRKGLE